MDYESTLREQEALREAIQRLREAVESSNPEIGHALKEMLTSVTAHFKMEEDEGFFNEIVLEHPELDARARRIERQHEVLLACFVGLVNDSQSGTRVGELAPQIISALDALKAHESAEFSLLQDSLLVDIGPGD